MEGGYHRKYELALDTFTIHAVTEVELCLFFLRIGNDEAINLNVISNGGLRSTVKTKPDWFISVFKVCKRRLFCLVEETETNFGTETQYITGRLIIPRTYSPIGKMLGGIDYNKLFLYQRKWG